MHLGSDFFHKTYEMLALFLMRSCLWRWGAWWVSYRAKRVCEVGRVALIEVRVVFGLQNRGKLA